MASKALFQYCLSSPPSSRSSSFSNRTDTVPLSWPQSAQTRAVISKPLLLSTQSRSNRNCFVTKCSANGKQNLAEDFPTELRYPTFPAVMDINKIIEILRHRFPFLMVDRVVEYTPGVSAVGIKNVTISENFFAGHFRDRPIMTGVLTIEAMAQLVSIIMLQLEVGGNRETLAFAGLHQVKFRKPVIAGDTLMMRATVTKLQIPLGFAKMAAKAYVRGEVVCEGQFMVTAK